MRNNVVRTLKRIAILSATGAIALSASAMTSPSAFAASPYTYGSDQPQYQNGQYQNGQYQNGQPQDGQDQNGQVQNGQMQNGQAQNNQNNQWQSNQPPKYNQNGQVQNGQYQGGQYENGQNQGWRYQNGQYQNGQNQGWQYQGNQYQGNQQWNQQNGRQYGQGQSNWPYGQGQNNLSRHRYDWSAYRPGRQPPQWQQYHRDFNPRPYQWNRISNQRYHYETYQRPHGWYPNRWVYGQTLPRLFWSQDFWLTGYYNYGLIDPPYGYVWVRNDQDAMLVDVESGIILSVQYNLFFS